MSQVILNPTSESSIPPGEALAMAALQRLREVIAGAADLQSAENHIRWLERLVHWIHESAANLGGEGESVRLLVRVVQDEPELFGASIRVFRQVLLETTLVPLFLDTGAHTHYDFFRECVARLIRRFLPGHGDPSSMETVLDRVFTRKHDPEWIDSLDVDVRSELTRELLSEPEFRLAWHTHLLREAAEACFLLCIRASAIAIQRELMERAGCKLSSQIPSLRLRPEVREYFRLMTSSESHEVVYPVYVRVLDEIEASRRYFEDVRVHIEQFGVSLNIVFSIESAHSILNRVEKLIRLAYWLRFEGPFDPWAMFTAFIRDNATEKRVGPLIRSNFHLLARKIVEKSGETGENYITATRGEYWRMFGLAAGGGVVTAFTALAKLRGPSESAPFLLGLYAFGNYSFSFLLMHHLHFKLATKQPAMTAAALASRLGAGQRAREGERFVDLVARISRSQFAAVSGNILAVIPVACLVDWSFRTLGGSNVVSLDESKKVLTSLNPLATLTIVYAALTGVLLWVSGLAAGWVENVFTYFQMPRALRAHPRLQSWLGGDRLDRWVDNIRSNLAGWIAAISLGFFLAFVPILGVFFGAPVDVRHVTLSTGAATYSIARIGWNDAPASFLWTSALGIVLIGSLNFGVSFVLAMAVAVRAKNVPRRRVWVILRGCLKEFRRRPLKFFLP